MIFLYLLSIIAVNFLFAHTEPIYGIPPATFMVGLVFVLRDYVQRKIGHKVLIVMIIACSISYFMASPMVATASMIAFICAELSDWGIYTIIKADFHYRILYSSVVGVFVDSIIFLPLVNMFSWKAVLIMWVSKMVCALVVFIYYEVSR